MKGRKFDEDVIHSAFDWLEDQYQESFYSGILALEKRWAKCILFQRSVLKSDKITYVLCCYLPSYKLFDHPS